jgi:hypothetical protein
MEDGQTVSQIAHEGAEPQGASQVDYFGFSETEKWYLPDGISYFELAAMNEGKKAKFQKGTQRDMVLEKGSGNARFKIDPAVERHQLIMASVTGWNLTRNGVPVPFGERAIRDFLELANPSIVEKLELAIRKLNPWLLADMTVEEIDKQIDELKELRIVAEEREAGEASSSSR